MLGMELDPFVVESATGDESQQTRLRAVGPRTRPRDKPSTRRINKTKIQQRFAPAHHRGATSVQTMTVTLRLEDAHTDGRTRRALHELSRAVVKSTKIVVVTGAGISCSCGIPVRGCH